jgi:hypothetical protein
MQGPRSTPGTKKEMGHWLLEPRLTQKGWPLPSISRHVHLNAGLPSSLTFLFLHPLPGLCRCCCCCCCWGGLGDLLEGMERRGGGGYLTAAYTAAGHTGRTKHKEDDDERTNDGLTLADPGEVSKKSPWSLGTVGSVGTGTGPPPPPADGWPTTGITAIENCCCSWVLQHGIKGQ